MQGRKRERRLEEGEDEAVDMVVGVLDLIRGVLGVDSSVGLDEDKVLSEDVGIFEE
jgi:hypothetical protein